MLLARTTLVHFKSFFGDAGAAVDGRARKHRGAVVAMCALIVGSANPALISLFALSTTSLGVFLGATTPCQPLAS
jgi:hypothetical protein